MLSVGPQSVRCVTQEILLGELFQLAVHEPERPRQGRARSLNGDKHHHGKHFGKIPVSGRRR
jgi:hypothetical protein